MKTKVLKRCLTRICAMKWWQENADSFPILNPIEMDELCVPVIEVIFFYLENCNDETSLNSNWRHH